jgi:hypothetical protein
MGVALSVLRSDDAACGDVARATRKTGTLSPTVSRRGVKTTPSRSITKISRHNHRTQSRAFPPEA